MKNCLLAKLDTTPTKFMNPCVDPTNDLVKYWKRPEQGVLTTSTWCDVAGKPAQNHTAQLSRLGIGESSLKKKQKINKDFNLLMWSNKRLS